MTGKHSPTRRLFTWSRAAWASAATAVATGIYSLIAGPPFVPHGNTPSPTPAPSPSTSGSIPRVREPGLPHAILPLHTSTFASPTQSGQPPVRLTPPVPVEPSKTGRPTSLPVPTKPPVLPSQVPLPKPPISLPPIPLPSVPPLPSPAFGRASLIVAWAKLQVGPPHFYQFGGNGPLGYDCSSLIKAAFGVVGFTMPRTAAEQGHVGLPVPMSNLEPADILLWGNPATHSAIYIGNGEMLGAQNPEVGIVIQPLSFDPPDYARRVL